MAHSKPKTFTSFGASPKLLVLWSKSQVHLSLLLFTTLLIIKVAFVQYALDLN